MKMFKKALSNGLNLIIICTSFLLLFNIFLDIQTSILEQPYKSFLGYSIFEIQTGSMSGAIEEGDCVLVKASTSAKLNDIITYKLGDNYITHRVVQKYQNLYVTKGDSNNTDDYPINNKQIVGIVVRVMPHMGTVRKVLFNPPILISFMLSLILLCMILDDKQDKKQSYISRIKRLFKKDKDKKVEDIKITPEQSDISKTTVLSKVEVPDNSKLYSSIKEDVEEEDVPKIIKII